MGDGDSRTIQSVDTACDILEALRERRGAPLRDLSDEVGRSPGTVHAHLSTLQDRGFVTKSDGEYRLGTHLVTLGEFVTHRHRLYRAGRRLVAQLADETGDCVHLLAEHQGQGVVLLERFGEEAVGTRYHARLRERPYQHLHCRANGKAILAHLPDERVDRILDRHGLDRKAPNTITDPEALREDLATVRERGYAVSDEEELRGIRAVGAPILDADERPLGAISVSAPRSRLTGNRFREEMPERMVEAANVIEVNVQTDDIDL